jgi:hypothetical protein
VEEEGADGSRAVNFLTHLQDRCAKCSAL